jgi:hypothetical protein
MAKEIIGASVEVEYKSVGEMRKAIKEATGDVIRMQQQFGNTSKEALAAAKRVAELKDRVKEASEVTQLFDPGNKFKALGNTIQVAAGGFAALQGAMGLFGVKSEEVEKQLLKVQSALALSQGLSTVADGAKEFGRLASMIKGPVVAAFTTLRGALMATGIGLITSAVAYLVTNFEKVKKVVYDTFPSLKGLFDNFDRIKQIAYGVGNAILQFIVSPVKALMKLLKGDFQGAMDEIKQGVSFTKNFRKGESDEIKSQQEEKDKARAEELAKQREANAARLAEQQRAAEQRRKERQAEYERQKAEQAKFEEESFQARVKALQREIDLSKQMAKDEQERKQIDKEIRAESDKADEERLNNIFASQIQRLADINNARQQDIANEQAATQMKMALYDQIQGGLLGLSELVGRQTALGKVLAIAEIAIGTARGFINGLVIAQQSAKATGPGAAIAFPLFYATQVAAVLQAAAKAKAVLSPVKGPSGGSFSAPSITAPLQPQLSPQAQSTALNSAAINNLGNNAIQAYILNSDLQSNAQINAILQRNASLG